MKLKFLLMYRDDRDKPVRWRWPPTCEIRLTRLKASLSDGMLKCIMLLYLGGFALVTPFMFAGPRSKVLDLFHSHDLLSWGIVISAYTLATGGAVLQLFYFLTGRFQQRLQEYFMSLSKCPACYCSMGGLPVEPDGCVVCPNPECGAAWRLTDRVQQP